LFAASISAGIVAGIGTILFLGLSPSAEGLVFAWERLVLLAIPAFIAGPLWACYIQSSQPLRSAHVTHFAKLRFRIPRFNGRAI
jgi:hypothetical protein